MRGINIASIADLSNPLFFPKIGSSPVDINHPDKLRFIANRPDFIEGGNQQIAYHWYENLTVDSKTAEGFFNSSIFQIIYPLTSPNSQRIQYRTRYGDNNENWYGWEQIARIRDLNNYVLSSDFNTKIRAFLDANGYKPAEVDA